MKIYNELFCSKNDMGKEEANGRVFEGYKTYNSKNEYVGVVFEEMAQGPSFCKCTMCFCESQRKRYGVFHIIKSNKLRIDFSFLEKQIKESKEYKFFVD